MNIDKARERCLRISKLRACAEREGIYFVENVDMCIRLRLIYNNYRVLKV